MTQSPLHDYSGINPDISILSHHLKTVSHRDLLIVKSNSYIFFVLNSQFSFFALNTGWEHFITDYQRNAMKYSVEMGFNFLQGYLPTPYLQGNYYLGQFPFYSKVSLGALAEILAGGHVGVYAMLGMEINSQIDFSIMATFWGSQPRVSYTDMETKIHEEGYKKLIFPYYGVFLTVKLNNISDYF